MNGRNRRPPAGQVESEQTAWTVVVGAMIATMLASVVAVIALVRTLDLGPRVGDILVFRPGADVQADWEVAAARPVDQPGSQTTATCVLRPDVMAVGGGSLVVEARAVRPMQYRVHWAGPRTALGNSDCGTAADLMVSQLDLQALINAAGGEGVEHRSFAMFR